MNADERAELVRFRRENKMLRNPKKASLLCERNKVQYSFIGEKHNEYPVTVLYRVTQVSLSACYDWRGCGGELINSDSWLPCHRM